MKIKQITKALENWAPLSLQEDYDNAGLLVGNGDHECEKILVCLDCDEKIIEEAIQEGCNLIIAHHPIIFKGLKQLTGANYVERIILKAVQHHIAIYAIHTNLDNVAHGVNNEIASKIGLHKKRILRPLEGNLRKLVTYVPPEHLSSVKEALFTAGAGEIGKYDQCSFSLIGTGTFRPMLGADPFSGEVGKVSTEEEVRLEVILPIWKEKSVLNALMGAHPYEEVAFYIQSLTNSNQETGSGMIGEFESEISIEEFLGLIKNVFGGPLKYTLPIKESVKKVALCGGSGSFLLRDAMNQQADVFLSSDFKYHQFFDADGKITIVDIGHYESEQFTINLIGRYLKEKFPNFAILLTQHITNPVNYL